METVQLYYLYDDEGFFIEAVEAVEGEDAPENGTLEVWSEPCFKPKFVDGKWIDGGTQKVDDEFLAMLKELEEMEKMLSGGGSNE